MTTLLDQAIDNLQRRAPHLFPADPSPAISPHTKEIAKFWASADEARRRPQLFADRGLSMLGTQGLRVLDGRIIAPMYRAGSIVNAQIAEVNGVVRLYWPHGHDPAGPFVIQRPMAAMTCVTTSILDALAVFQSVRNAAVCVAASAGAVPAVLARVAGSAALVDRLFDDTEGRCAIAALKEWGDGAPRRIERVVLAAAKLTHHMM